MHVTVYGMLAPGLPASVFVEKGICPSYNSLSSSILYAITGTGTTHYAITLTGLPVDSCIALKAVIGGGNAAGFSSVFSFTNTSILPTVFTASIISSSDTICNGDSTLMMASVSPSGFSYKYHWRKNGVVLSNDTLSVLFAKTTGIYDVVISLNSFSDTSNSKNVFTLAAPLISSWIISGGNLVLTGDFKFPVTVKFNGNIHTATLYDSTTVMVPGITTFNSGDVISVSYANGCTSSETILFAGVDENQSKVETTIYPNPTTNYINVVSSRGKELTICNLLGQILLSKKITDDNEKINFILPNGVYIYTIKDKLKMISSKLVVN